MKVSVIIPTYNRSSRLTHLLNSIENQSNLTDIEIIIIDNGSTDETKKVVQSYTQALPNLSYEFNDIPGLLTGRHMGAEIATGDILCFLDDDVKLNPHYFQFLPTSFSNPSVQLATGPCLAEYEIEPPYWLNYFWTSTSQGKHCGWLSLIDFGNQETREIHPNFVWGLNFCIRKEAFKILGGFHPDCIPSHLQKYQGDGETGLTQKAAQKDFKAFYYPQLSLSHYVPQERLTLDYFKKRAYYQGICESFTQLRSSYFNTEKIVPETKKTLRDKLHPYYRWIKLLLPRKGKKINSEVDAMLKILKKCENDGYTFHQNQFNTNKLVKQWVLKENYWDYNLPTND